MYCLDLYELHVIKNINILRKEKSKYIEILGYLDLRAKHIQYIAILIT